MTNKLVIIDRDGVINQETDYYITCADDFHFQPGAVEGLVRLHQHGFTIAIATNQAGIDRGYLSHATLAGIHAKMCLAIRQAGGAIDRILYAARYDDNHPWRKPNPGMLHEIMAEYGVSNQGSTPFIGDSMSDLQAALQAGCKPLLVRTGKGAKTESEMPTALKQQTTIFADLNEASKQLTGTGTTQ